MSLSSIVDSNQPLILLQSSCAQSCIPILKYIVSRAGKSLQDSPRCLIFSHLIPTTDWLDANPAPEHVKIRDFTTTSTPGYSDSAVDHLKIIASTIHENSGPLKVVIDAIDTLVSDVGPLSRVYSALRYILGIVRARGDDSSLILHGFQQSSIIPLLLQPTFSPSVSYIIAHPPALFRHLAQELLTTPPPGTESGKFWSAFLPLSERIHDIESLIYGANGEGSGTPNEMVVEFILRARDGVARRRNIERGLEGWLVPEASPCPLIKMESLKGIWKTKPQVEEAASEAAHQTSFNLQLTGAQKESRAQVPLPYIHKGKGTTAVPAIYYDPDSADDMDDDDPDEDLNI